jgi:hypothetical protein
MWAALSHPLTGAWPLGIELPPDYGITLGNNSFDELVGSEMFWPQGISNNLPVEERFVVFVSNHPVSLNYLVESVNLAVDILRDATEFVMAEAHRYVSSMFPSPSTPRARVRRQ